MSDCANYKRWLNKMRINYNEKINNHNEIIITTSVRSNYLLRSVFGSNGVYKYYIKEPALSYEQELEKYELEWRHEIRSSYIHGCL